MYALKAPLPLKFDHSTLAGLAGVKVDGDQILFSKDWTEEKIDGIIKAVRPEDKQAGRFAHTKVFNPTQYISELKALMPAHSSEALEEFMVVEMRAANTMPDYEKDIFNKGFLDELARLINKAPINFLHNHDNGKTLGKVFKARVDPITNSSDFVLITTAYFPPNKTIPDGSNQTVQDALKDNTIDKVSVRVAGPRRILETEKGFFREFYNDPDVAETIIMEISSVFFHGQRDARVELKSISPAPPTLKKGTMTEEQIKALKDQSDGLKKENVELKAISEKYTAVQKTLDTLMEGYMNNIQNKQKGLLPVEYTEDQLKGFDPEQLKSLDETVEKAYLKANPPKQVPDGTGGTAESKTAESTERKEGYK